MRKEVFVGRGGFLLWRLFFWWEGGFFFAGRRFFWWVGGLFWCEGGFLVGKDFFFVTWTRWEGGFYHMDKVRKEVLQSVHQNKFISGQRSIFGQMSFLFSNGGNDINKCSFMY